MKYFWKKCIKSSVLSKLTVFTVVLLMVMTCVGGNAHAETLTKDLVSLQEVTNLAIVVEYTDDGSGEAPKIAFVNPSGKVFQEGVTSEDKMSVEHKDKSIFFMIPDAEAGTWKIRYDSAFTGRLSVTTSSYSRDARIESFEIESVSDDSANVSFLTSFPVDCPYVYQISAVITNESGFVTGEKELCTGSAVTNKKDSVQVSLEELASFEHYRLQLQIFVDDHGVELTDTALSDPFDHQNPAAPNEIGDFFIVLNRTNGDLAIDWTNAKVFAADSYILGVFNSLNPDEPFYNNIFDSESTSTAILCNPEVDWVRIELSYTQNGKTSKVKTVTFNPNEVKFDIVTGESTSSSQAEVSYEVPSGEVELYLYTNEMPEGLKPVRVSGTGKVAVNMAQFQNVVTALYKPNEYLTIKVEKEIFSDRRAPILTFLEDVHSITTAEDIFRLGGMTEADATMTVNGEPSAINEDGSFVIELKLQEGINRFEIITSDAAGNQTKRTVVITRAGQVGVVDDKESSGSINYLPLIITIVLSLALAISVAVLFNSKHKPINTAEVLLRSGILGWGLSGISLAGTIWLLVLKVMASNAVNTEKFFDYVQASVEEAYAMLADFQWYTHWFTIALIITGVFVLASVSLTIAGLVMRKKGNEPPKAPKPSKEPKQPKRHKKEKAPKPEKLQAVIETKPEPSAAPAAPKTNFCPNCGKKCAPEDVFCVNCGYKLK